jgi:hypothetical protein
MASGLIAYFTWHIVICNLGTSCVCPLCFLRKLCRYYYFWGRQKKQVERLFFCSGIIERTQVWSCLSIWCLFHIAYCFFLFNKEKKNWGEFAGFFFLGLLDSACIFTWYLNSVSINLLCLDIIESLWLYWPNFFPVYAKVG